MWFALYRRLFLRRVCEACGVQLARRDGFCSDGCAKTFLYYD